VPALDAGAPAIPFFLRFSVSISQKNICLSKHISKKKYIINRKFISKNIFLLKNMFLSSLRVLNLMAAARLAARKAIVTLDNFAIRCHSALLSAGGGVVLCLAMRRLSLTRARISIGCDALVVAARLAARKEIA
jgi:hypothetical protein